MQASILQPRVAVQQVQRTSTTRHARQHAVLVRAQKQEGEQQPMLSRRESLLAAAAGVALVGGAVVPAAPAAAAEGESRLLTKYIQPENLSVFQKKGQKELALTRAITEVKKVLTKDDAPAALRALLNDAATYDVATGTGGVNGSIVFSDELNRPENASLKAYVDKLKPAKAAIDADAAKIGQAAISWADLLVVAGKVAAEQLWYDIKVNRAELASGGKVIAENFATEFPIVLGREDAAGPDPAGRLPKADAPVEEIRDFFLQLGAKPKSSGPIQPKAPFWERVSFVLWPAAAADPAAEEARLAAGDAQYASFKRKYDLSRRTVTRTDYEVDFIEYFNKLANLGAKIDPNRYLFPIEIQVPKNF